MYRLYTHLYFIKIAQQNLPNESSSHLHVFDIIGAYYIVFKRYRSAAPIHLDIFYGHVLRHDMAYYYV